MDVKRNWSSRWSAISIAILALATASGCAMDKLSSPLDWSRQGIAVLLPNGSSSELGSDGSLEPQRHPRIATEQAPPALQLLGEQLQSASPEARAVAIAQLGEVARRGERGSYPAIELLTSVMQSDADTSVRIAATDALAGLESPEASANLDDLIAQTAKGKPSELEPPADVTQESKSKVRLSFLPSFLR